LRLWLRGLDELRRKRRKGLADATGLDATAIDVAALRKGIDQLKAEQKAKKRGGNRERRRC
jgi:hypothetical protein